MRRMHAQGKPFKGSVFVEFATAETAASLPALLKEGKLQWKETPIASAELKMEYFGRKAGERADKATTKAAGKAEAVAKNFAAPEARKFERYNNPGCILKITGLGPSASGDSLRVREGRDRETDGGGTEGGRGDVLPHVSSFSASV